IGLTKGSDDAVAAALGRSQADEQDLVLIVVDDRDEVAPASRQVRGGQLAFEDGVLQVVAIVAHGLEDFAQALVVADVVADKVTCTHPLTINPERIGRSRSNAGPPRAMGRAPAERTRSVRA